MPYQRQRNKIITELDQTYELLSNEVLCYKFEIDNNIKMFNIKALENRQDNSMNVWFSLIPYYKNFKFENDLTYRSVSIIIGLITGLKDINFQYNIEDKRVRANTINVVPGTYWINIENKEGRPQQLAIENFTNY